MEGFIQLHRKMLEWEWYDDINTKTLFIHLLLKANWKDKSWRGIDIKRGELLTGRITLADETGLSEQQIRTSLTKLKSTSEITIKPTSKYSIIKLLNYNEYQGDNQQDNQQVTSNQPTSNQQVTTTNKDNNSNKEKKEIYKGGGDSKLLEEELAKFIKHWNLLYKEERRVTEALVSSYKIKRKIYSVEDFYKGYSNYNEAKKTTTEKKFLLSPLGLIEQKNGFISYL